jgi:two-component system chemotaxis response regulator CheY
MAQLPPGKELTMHKIERSLSLARAQAAEPALHILLAEDNRQLRTLMTMAIYNDGHSVDEFTDGAELVEQIATSIIEGREDEIDVIIAEQELPAVPGLTVLAGLRGRGHSVAFVLMTADEDVQARARGLRAAVLDRPFDLGAIREAIRQARALTAPGTGSRGAESAPDTAIRARSRTV